MEVSNRKRFFLFLAVLIVFSLGTALFVHEDDMVYEPAEPVPEDSENDSEGEGKPADGTEAVAAAAAERDFFASFRLERSRRRDREAELYREILADEGRDETARKEASAALTGLYRKAGLEDEVEQILVGRGYGDALFVIEDTVSLLIIKGEALRGTETADLAAFVSSYAGLGENGVSVFTAE